MSDEKMPVMMAYSFVAKTSVPVVEMELVRYRNGRYGIRGEAGAGPVCRVSRVISAADAERLQAAGYEVISIA